jgi:endonuclease/exonuclease/phosphatase family metal-dependent hydrolase
MVRKEKPDVIAFQELTHGLAIPLEAELGTDYPYTIPGDNMGGFTVAIASRYPLTKAPRPLESQRIAHATLQTPEGPIDMWNIHPVVAVSSERWQIQREIIEAVVGEVARGGFGFTFPMITSQPPRHQPWHRQLLYLLAPVVRIDHILVSSHFTVQEAHFIPDNLGSDHRPVVATLQLKP